jgi:preprotein translocase subunit SecD
VASPQSSRPGRTLLALAVLLVAMVATMFATGATSPRLGLDLQGGTSVVLQPRVSGGGDVGDAALRQAVDIIRQRVNGLGVTEADVQTQGDNIVVSVPGATNQEAVELIASTAQLRFRPVLQLGVGTPAPTPSPTPSGTETGSATPSPTPTGTQSPDQNRAVPRALRKAATTPAPSASTTTTPTPSAEATTPPPTDDVAAALLREYERIDCSDPENRQGGSDEPADEPIVACDREGSTKFLLGPTAVEGTRIDEARAGIPDTTTEWIVELEFDGRGADQFRDVTTRLAASTPPRNQFAIVLDNVVVSAPQVEAAIPNGRAQIEGSFTEREARDLANVLRYGALPLTFDQGEVNSISASVGEDQLEKGVLAGIVGLVLVVVYSLLFYRALGVVSIFSLAVAALITWGTVSLLGDAIDFALILAGVIGVIVSIGITADSFVVFFERLRDEIREGRPIRTAVEQAWVRARRTILVADAVTFLAALVLYFLSIGRVQNFAFTLGLTTLVDVVVVFLFTKPLVTWLVRGDFFGRGHRLSGLNPELVGLRVRAAGGAGRQAAASRAPREG